MVRRLGGIEQYFYQRSSLNLHSCFSVGVELNSLPNRSDLICALRRVVNSHFQLYCNAYKSNNEVVVNPIGEPIKFDDVVDYMDWDTYGEEEINSVFRKYNFEYGVDKPLWKVIVVSKANKMIFATDHLFFDGIATVLFWTELLKSLEELKQDNDLDVDEIIYRPGGSTDSIDQCHPYEKLPIPFSWKVKRPIVKALFTIAPGAVVSQDASIIQFDEYKIPEDYLKKNSNDDGCYQIKNTNRQISLKMSSNKLKVIMKDCKQHHVSFTAYLTAVLYLALGKIPNEKYSGSTIKYEVPMNTRNRISNSGEYSNSYGTFVAGGEFIETLDFERDEWELAQSIHQKIVEKSTTGVMDAINEARLLELVDAKKFMKMKFETTTGPSSTFEVTNLGFQNFSQNEHSKYTVTDAFFNEPQLFTNLITYSVISTPSGGLNCSMAYPEKLDSILCNSVEFLKNKFN